MYYVYILESIQAGQLYIGSTNDLRRRLNEHNQGKSFATKHYGQWKLVYYEAYLFETLARMREKRLKAHGNAIRELKKRIYPERGFIQHHSNGAGFTLMELLIVMAILGILITVGLTSYKSVQAKSRDARRKSDMRQIASALELYYNDYDRYPPDTNNVINGCGTAGTSACAWGSAFQTLKADGISVKTMYMPKLSGDPVGTYNYYYDVYGGQGKGFQLYARLENSQDIDLKRDGSNNIYYYTGTVCMTGNKKCNFGITSSNLTLDDASQGHTLTTTD